MANLRAFAMMRLCARTEWVAASSPENVWVAGPTATGNYFTRVYRYDGSRWHSVPGTWAKDVWAVGVNPGSSRDAGRIVAYRRNGSRWLVVPDGHGGVWLGEYRLAPECDLAWQLAVLHLSGHRAI
jgi:hypothetical protein